MMNSKHLYSLFTAVLCFSGVTYSQELNIDQQTQLETMAETILEDDNENSDLSNYFEDIEELLEHPINLNTANEKELQRLNMLTSFQIAVIIDYRKKTGTIQSVYELGYLPGFRESDIKMIAPYVICEAAASTGIPADNWRKKTKSNLLIRYQRVIEEQTGYKSIPDSVLADNPDKSRYMGSPDKLYLKYGLSVAKQLDAGIVLDKDAGEEFFSGSNNNGFDFYSAHLIYRNEKKFIQTIALGDYHLQFGQGLLMWSSYAGFKTGSTNQLAKRPVAVKKSFSSDENRFLRGAAITLGKADFNCTIFGSYHKIDAGINIDSNGIKRFTGFTATGNHNTPADLSKEDQLPVSIGGISLRYEANRLKAGINAVYTEFGYLPEKPDKLYKNNNFTDHRIFGSSIDYRYLAKTFNFFGELAFSNNALALLNGIEFYLSHGLSIGVLHRHYAPEYFSIYNGAFGENSEIANENGFFLGTEARMEKLSFRVYGDVFSFPWLKYQVNSPSEGSELFAELSYRIHSVDFSIRYKSKEKPNNYTNEDFPVATICPFKKEQYRFNTIYPLGDYLKLQSRFEFSVAGYSDSAKHTGYCLIQDISTSELKVPFNFSLRIAHFNIADYNARIYTYEKDVLFAYSSQMYYRKGWRFAFLAKWKLYEPLTFYLKYSFSYYPDETSIGSGLTEIQTNRRSEIKAELIYRF